MKYIERDDLIERFGEHEISDLERNITKSGTDEQNIAATESAISDACGEVDSYIATRYPLPIPSIPEQLKLKTCDIARYRLHKDQATEEVEKRYKEAISWLKDVSMKKAVLIFPVDTPEPAPTPSSTTTIFVV